MLLSFLLQLIWILVVLDKNLLLDLGKTFFCLLDKGQKTVKCIEGESSTYYLTYRSMIWHTEHPISALLLYDP